MKEKKIEILYWGIFILSVFILLINFGIILISLELLLFLPALILHFILGLKLKKINDLKNGFIFIFVSSISLLLSALFRVDGAHTFSENGLSSFLSLFGLFAGFNEEYINQYFLISFISLAVMITTDIIILKKIKANKPLSSKHT